MSKNIVFCADGTWYHTSDPDDEYGGADACNVYKLYLKLECELDAGSVRLADEQEKTLRAADNSVAQVAKYLHGVGDSRNFLVKALGGAVGAGLIARIVRGYTFVSRNYAEGDRICLVGF
jgi:glutathione S-transferase